MITADLLSKAIERDPAIAQVVEAVGGFWGSFQPRPDRPELFDEQSAFVNDRSSLAWLIKGNASGGTEAAAFKTANFLLHQQRPPRRNTPFWIVSNTYDQTVSACWCEKLEGNGHIPPCEIEWDKIEWSNYALRRPAKVPLKPWPGDTSRNWMIVFKSFDQEAKALQAQSIGGFWISEQPPEGVFFEIFRGCRDYLYPGGQFVEFTPTNPANWPWIEKFRDNPPPGWKFYRCNTECNTALADGFIDQFKAAAPEESLLARLTGASPTFVGQIYQTFNPAIHVIPHDQFAFPPNAQHYRGLDWGASAEHPFVCLWGYRDGMGDWWVYDEYWNNSQGMTMKGHADEVAARWEWPDGEQEYGPAYGDPSRPDVLNLFNELGIVTYPARNSVYKGIDTIRSFLKVNPATTKPRLFICRERCPHLIQELQSYRWKQSGANHTGFARQAPPPVPLKKNDDTCDALRYMIYSVESSQGTAPGSMVREPHRRASLPLERVTNRGRLPGMFVKLQ